MKEKVGGRERDRDRWDMGKVLFYLASIEVNLHFSASISADLHKLRRRYILFFAISAGKAHPHPWTLLFA